MSMLLMAAMPPADDFRRLRREAARRSRRQHTWEPFPEWDDEGRPMTAYRCTECLILALIRHRAPCPGDPRTWEAAGAD
jgi:hypothetical protein